MNDVLDTWFLSLMMTGEFHADLHAGNLMLLDDGRIAFLDFGLMGQIQPSSLQACFNLVQKPTNERLSWYGTSDGQYWYDTRT